MGIRVVTDSTCDLPPDILAEHGITVVPLYVNAGDESYLDGLELSREEFYLRLPDWCPPPTTSVPGLGVFLEAYEKVVAEGATEVLSIHVSESLSSIVSVARSAAKSMDGVPITVVDSGQLSLGTGLLVLSAARDATAGCSMWEILRRVEEKALHTHTFAALDTIEFLRRSGRVSQIQSGLGALLRIKPLLKMHNGRIEMERVRTRRRAMERLLELASGLGTLEELALVHTCAPDRAEALRQRAEALIPEGQTPICAEVTPVIGTHVGPGAVGLVCVARRTA